MVGVRAEATALGGNIVGHNQVEFLAVHFGLGVSHQVLALRSKAHSHKMAFGRFENIGGLGQGNVQVVVGFLDLLVSSLCGTVVGDGSSHDQRVSLLRMFLDRGSHLFGGANLDHVNQSGVGQISRGRHQHYICSPVAGRFRHGIAHLARRVVGDHSNRIDRLHGASSADHHSPASQVSVFSHGVGNVAQ